MMVSALRLGGHLAPCLPAPHAACLESRHCNPLLHPHCTCLPPTPTPPPPPTHPQGGTYGGSAIGCAAAAATIDVIKEEGLLQNAAERGQQLTEGLLKLSKVGVVEGGGGGGGNKRACLLQNAAERGQQA